jgi:hypothetical protein
LIQIVTKYDNKILLPLLVVVFLFLNPTPSGLTKVTCWWWFHLWGNDFMKCNHFTQDAIKWIGLIVATPLWRSVRMTLTLLKWGLGSPPGLPKTQSSISGVKTPCLEVFFMLLERSWSIDAENGLAWAIRTSSAQVMWKRRVGSQTGSLTPDPGVCRWSATNRWEALKESYKFALDLIPIRGLSKELRAAKIPRIQTGTISRLLLGRV